jgi:hypothetical protein
MNLDSKRVMKREDVSLPGGIPATAFSRRLGCDHSFTDSRPAHSFGSKNDSQSEHTPNAQAIDMQT